MSLVREEIEWSQFRWNNTLDQKLPRVLLIGDSIVAGSWEKVARILDGKVNIASFATSKCVGDPDYDRELKHAVSDYRWSLIYFNNGLHGFTATEKEYAKGLRKVLKKLLKLAGKTPVIWRTSTPITIAEKPEQLDPEKNPRVIARNRLAAKIMKKAKIQIDDLYNVVVNRPELSAKDGYHYNDDGTTTQAQHIAKTIRKALKIKK